MPIAIPVDDEPNWLDNTAEALRALRGTPEETMARIRAHHGIGSTVPCSSIIVTAFVEHSGAAAEPRGTEEARRFDTFLRTGEPEGYELPLDVQRAGDKGVRYPSLLRLGQGS